MKKKIYRVFLNTPNSSIEKLALLACYSNGSADKVTIQDLVGVFNADKMRYPLSLEGHTLEQFPNSISIDKTDGEKATNVLFIEEVEIIELNPEDNEN